MIHNFTFFLTSQVVFRIAPRYFWEYSPSQMWQQNSLELVRVHGFFHISGQIITTSAEVTLNGGLIRELPPNPLNSGLGIILILPRYIISSTFPLDNEGPQNVPPSSWTYKNGTENPVHVEPASLGFQTSWVCRYLDPQKFTQNIQPEKVFGIEIGTQSPTRWAPK